MALAETADYRTSGWVREKKLNQEIKRQRTTEAQGDGVNCITKIGGYSDQRTRELWESDLVSAAIHKDTHVSAARWKTEGNMHACTPVDFVAYFLWFTLIGNISVASPNKQVHWNYTLLMLVNTQTLFCTAKGHVCYSGVVFKHEVVITCKRVAPGFTVYHSLLRSLRTQSECTRRNDFNGRCSLSPLWLTLYITPDGKKGAYTPHTLPRGHIQTITHLHSQFTPTIYCIWSPIGLTCMFSDCGRTHTDTGRTWKLNTVRSNAQNQTYNLSYECLR